jgi:predicted dehydrogenase
MRKIQTAVIGAGFMGKVHAEGIRRQPNVEIAAVCGIDAQEGAAFGEAVGVERTSGDWKEIVADPRIEALHICTPNNLHYPIAKAAMLAGKHVLCEKPLTNTLEEAQELVEIAKQRNVANCTNHNLRYYPAVQQMRRMVEAGELGDILVVQGNYSQDWLLYETDWNWRIVSREGGALRCMGDIGSHWMDMVQHITGQRITSLCADLQTFLKTRKKPKTGALQAFESKMAKAGDREEVAIDTDDYGAVLLRLGERTRGAFTVSQMSAGCKNRLQMEVFGTKCGVSWNQESPDQLWIGRRDTANGILVKDPALMLPEARTYADLPGGHSEGYDDAHKMVYRRFYRTVADRSAPVEYPTFADGLRGMYLLGKVLESAQKSAWVATEEI